MQSHSKLAFIHPLRPKGIWDALPRIHPDALMAPNRILPHGRLGSKAVALIHAFAGEIAISSVVVLTKLNLLTYMNQADRLSNTYAMRLFNFARSRSSLVPDPEFALKMLFWNRGVKRRDACTSCWREMAESRCRMCFGTITESRAVVGVMSNSGIMIVNARIVPICGRCSGYTRGHPACKHNSIRQQILGKRALFDANERMSARVRCLRRCHPSDCKKLRMLLKRQRAHRRLWRTGHEWLLATREDPIHETPTARTLGAMIDYCSGSLRADTTRLTRALA